MRLKLDENLPVTLAPRLRERGHDVDTVLWTKGSEGDPTKAGGMPLKTKGAFS